MSEKYRVTVRESISKFLASDVRMYVYTHAPERAADRVSPWASFYWLWKLFWTGRSIPRACWKSGAGETVRVARVCVCVCARARAIEGFFYRTNLLELATRTRINRAHFCSCDYRLRVIPRDISGTCRHSHKYRRAS